MNTNTAPDYEILETLDDQFEPMSTRAAYGVLYATRLPHRTFASPDYDPDTGEASTTLYAIQAGDGMIYLANRSGSEGLACSADRPDSQEVIDELVDDGELVETTDN